MAKLTFGQVDGAAAVDSDADGLPDVWETEYFGNLESGGDADGDGDGLDNAFEAEVGTDPTKADTDGDGNPDWVGVPGYMFHERWEASGGWGETYTPSLRDARPERETGDGSRTLIPGCSVNEAGEGECLRRFRGQLIAPESGTFQLWIAGSSNCELWVSPDESKFGARREAFILEKKTGLAPGQWDRFKRQGSRGLELEKGKAYYIEVVHRESAGENCHLGLAWKYGGREREPIPAEWIKSYVPDPDDVDDDGMRDSWEAEFAEADAGGSLDPWDDPDDDGVPNYWEFIHESHPLERLPVEGYLVKEEWAETGGGRLRAITGRQSWADGAESKRARSGSTRWDVPPADSGVEMERFRGTITAPETGDYTFKLHGRGESELWLSTGESRFEKRLIARLDSNITGFHSFLSESSVPIPLVAGQRYYVEFRWSGEGERSTKHGMAWRFKKAGDWADATLGEVGQGSGWRENGTGARATFSGAVGAALPDRSVFRYRTLKGNRDLIIRLGDIRGINGRAGIMVRETLDPDSPSVCLFQASSSEIGMSSRETEGAEISSAMLVPESSDQWLRLIRRDHPSLADCSRFLAYSSPDGVNWGPLGEMSAFMGDEILWGVAAGVSGEGGRMTAQIPQIAQAVSPKHIPGNALTTPADDPADGDDDSLPDVWEKSVGLDATTAGSGQGEFGDPDGDGLTNWEEFKLGSDPLRAGGVAGHLTQELWFEIDGERVSDLTTDAHFYDPPDDVGLVAGLEVTATSGGYSSDNFGRRLRGTLTAPESGDYRFWIAGDDGCELWLSSTSSKFERSKIASIHAAGSEVWTNFREWDRHPDQRSDPLRLVAGQEYYIEVLHKERSWFDHVSVAWAYAPEAGRAVPREPVPSEHLRSFSADPEDVDGDGMRDSWERAHFGGLGHDGSGDGDGDGLTDLQEFLAGYDPNNPDSDGDGSADGVGARGFLSQEIWEDVLGTELRALTSSPEFAAAPSITRLITSAESLRNLGENFGTRLRGTLVPARAGNYTFWIAADERAELWLSDSASKFDKLLIALVSEATGARRWDVSSGQVSRTIYLEAGREYHIEALAKESTGADHLSVAWRAPGGKREVIPGDQLRSFSDHPDDSDDDYLPDSWENRFGLRVTGDGDPHDPLQGEFGDFDGDGLTNRQEWIYGTDPTSGDSDGDGLGDYLEPFVLGSDPTRRDFTPGVSTPVSLANYRADSVGQWFDSPDGLILADYRGEIGFDFDVPEDGFYFFRFTGSVTGGSLDLDDFRFSLDGLDLTVVQTAVGVVVGRFPQLAAGESHQLRILWDNARFDRSLVIDAIEIQAILPADADRWLEDVYALANYMDTAATTSFVSPVCIEGKADYPALVAVTTDAEDDEEIAVGRSPENGWWADVDLEPDTIRTITASFEGGVAEDEISVDWTPIAMANADRQLGGREITIRAGDSLLFYTRTADSTPYEFALGSDKIESDPAETSLAIAFDEPGSYVLTAKDGADTHELRVEVRGASFGGPVYVVRSAQREVVFPDIGADIAVESDPAITFYDLGMVVGAEGGRAFVAGAVGGTPHPVVARLDAVLPGQNRAPILDATTVSSLDLKSGNDTGLQLVEQLPGGGVVTDMRVIMPDLPPGVTVEVYIFIGGVFFDDGSVSKMLTADDFDEFGVATVRFVKMDSSHGGFCHRIRLHYDGEEIGGL